MYNVQEDVTLKEHEAFLNERENYYAALTAVESAPERTAWVRTLTQQELEALPF